MRQLRNSLFGFTNTQGFLQVVILVDLNIKKEPVGAVASSPANGAIDGFDHVVKANLADNRIPLGCGCSGGRFLSVAVHEVLFDQQLQCRIAMEVNLRQGRLHGNGNAVLAQTFKLNDLCVQGTVFIQGLEIFFEVPLTVVLNGVKYRQQHHAVGVQKSEKMGVGIVDMHIGSLLDNGYTILGAENQAFKAVFRLGKAPFPVAQLAPLFEVVEGSSNYLNKILVFIHGNYVCSAHFQGLDRKSVV